MRHKVFSIHDVKSAMYHPPMVFLAVGAAIRWFSDMVNDPSTVLSKHPEDYMLYEVGEFDDNSAGLEPMVPPRYVCVGSDYVLVKVPQLPELKDFPKVPVEPENTVH